ncbi:MAG: excinuclease ABC subunit UvrA, partial [Anaerolineales bacterium]
MSQQESLQVIPEQLLIGDITVRGARQHNLKNIDVVIPRHKLVVITGVSGSGKSSLAFDTIYAEGQRRYVESLSSFARQFMEMMEKPQVDQITGLSPAIAIEQKTISRNPRSTVGTVTEILDYLRVLYARVGTPHCPECGREVIPQSAHQITTQVISYPTGTRFRILAPIVRNQKGTHYTTLKAARKEGYNRARVDGEDILLDAPSGLLEIDKKKKHNIELVVDRLIIPPQNELDDFRTRLMDSVETALKAADGIVIIKLDDQEITLSEHNACPDCGISFGELQPPLFSFNSPIGMCPECSGLGIKLQVDPDLIISHPEKSLLDGASRYYGNLRKSSYWRLNQVQIIAEHYKADLELPWQELPEEFRHAMIYGSDGVKFHFNYDSPDGTWSGQSHREIKGLIFHINRLFRQTKSEYSKRHYLQFMSKLPCPACEGERLIPQARFVTVNGKRLPELTSWSIEEIHDWISQVLENLNTEQQQIAGELVNEIYQRLNFIRNVGLHYLTLDRPAPSLSGGEGQRIRLASQIGSGLVGV